MPITLLISQKDHLRRVAYLKDGLITDIDLEASSLKIPFFSSLDQIYWGRVVRVESAHAFVKLTENIVGLLPFEPSFPKPIEGQTLLVQVRREAIPDKGTQHKGTLLTRKIILGDGIVYATPSKKNANCHQKFKISPHEIAYKGLLMGMNPSL